MATSLGVPVWAAAEPPLAQAYTVDWFREHLQPQADFRPYPTASERDPWSKQVDPELRERLIKAAEAAQKQPWDALPATRYLDFVRNGNRSNFEALYFARRQRIASFTIAECLEGQGRFIDDVVNGVWLVCEESSWTIPAAIDMQRAGVGLPDVNEPVLDLFAPETAVQLAWVSYLLGPQLDQVSPLVCRRIAAEIDRRVLTPFLARDDFRWMGSGAPRPLNNWTPWIVSNVLASGLLIESDPARRAQIAHRCLTILDRYLATQPADGGCDEGSSYWRRAAASAFDGFDLLYRSTRGELNGFTSPKLRELAKYIYRVQIADEWFVNFADATAHTVPDAALCYRFGQRIDDPAMSAFGAWFAGRSPTLGVGPNEGLLRLIPAVLHSREIKAAPAVLPLPRDAWWPDLQVMVARAERGSSRGLFLAAKGGHNSESHNHNDVGSCIVFADGRPVFIDSGSEAYTRKTFSAQRYEIWTMQSAYHNLPTINGTLQAPGREFAARDSSYEADDRTATFSLDLAGAYPAAAQVARWRRTYVLTRPDRLTLTDDYTLQAATAPSEWHFLVAVEPKPIGPGQLRFYGDSPAPVDLRFDPAFRVRVERIELGDQGLQRIWGKRIYRLTFTQPQLETHGTFTIELSVQR